MHAETVNDGTLPSYKVAIVAPTCFYYQAPLFQELADRSRMDLTVYFCSEEASIGSDVFKKFKSAGHWGVEEDILNGYKHKFLRNYSPWPSYLTSVVGLMNFGIWKEIVKTKPNAVILMSWMNPSWWLAVLACVVKRIPIFYLTDQNVQRDLLGPKWKRFVKRLLLGRLLFRLTSGFLCAGTANRLLYEYYGVPDHKLVPFAFSWGFESLLRTSDQLSAPKSQYRMQLGFPEDNYTVLYCGRLSPEKSPIYAIQAFANVPLPNKSLIIVGDGVLKESLMEYVATNKIESVYFCGFKNRRELPKYYAASDVLVLPSDQETWGIVVNEAMCFGLPVLASDQVGAARDLVRPGYNGFTFPQGDVDELSKKIQWLMSQSPAEMQAMAARSRELIEKWVKRSLIDEFEQHLDLVYSSR